MMMSGRDTFRREILPFERRFLRSPAANISLLARVKGSISEEEFRAALRKVEKMHPLMRVRVELNERQEGFFTSEGVPEIPVNVVPRASDEDWMEEMRRLHLEPFSMERGPLIRFSLLRSEETSEILVFCQHMICDGLSLSYIARDVLSHIADPDLEADVVEAPLLTPENYPVKANQGLVTKLAIKKIRRQWRDRETLFDEGDFREIHKIYWGNYTYRALPMEFTRAETERFVQACRENSTTVNSALCAAFLLSHLEATGRQDLNPHVVVPVNVREMLKEPVGEAMGLYASGVKFKYRYEPRKPLWENVRVFDREVKKRVVRDKVFQLLESLTGLPDSLSDAFSFAFLGRMVPPDSERYEKLHEFSADEDNIAVKLGDKMRGETPGLALTNLGRLGFPERYGDLTLDRFIIAPSTGPFLKMVVGAATAAGRLSVTVNYIEEVTERGLMEDIRDRVMKLLKST